MPFRRTLEQDPQDFGTAPHLEFSTAAITLSAARAVFGEVDPVRRQKVQHGKDES